MSRMMNEDDTIWRIKVTYDETNQWATPPTTKRRTTFLGPYRSKNAAKGQLSTYARHTGRTVIAVEIHKVGSWLIDEAW